MEEIWWEKLRELISKEIGFRIRQQDIHYFKQKIVSRIQELKLENVKEYYTLLGELANIKDYNLLPKQALAEKEWKKLANVITNGESFFFRDRGQFDLLANQILPEIIASKREAKRKGDFSFLTLKVWSAGCSSGEEVYSLAMLISELIPDLEQWHIVILGTDINQDFLNLARQGIYKQWSFRLTEPILKKKYFIAGKDCWQVKPHLKSMISFYQDNLVEVANISHHNYDLDLVLCRNVFIYFDTDSIVKAVTKIAKTLRPGGYFVSGHAELQSIQLKNFKVISFPESVVYQYLANNQEVQALLTKANVEDNALSVVEVLKENDVVASIDFQQDYDNQILFEQENNPLPIKPITETKQNTAIVANNFTQLQLKEIENLFNQEQYSDVIQQAEELIKNQSELKEAYYLIAQAYANQNKLKEAKQNCDRALSIDSIYIKPLYLLAQITETENDYRRAKELLKKIIYIEPFFINAYLDLGAIYRQENNLVRSQKMYQTAYNLLQTSAENIKIGDQEQTNIEQLITYIKQNL